MLPIRDHKYKALLLGLDLPLSYSHRLLRLTLAPRPVLGVGVLGALAVLESRPIMLVARGDGDPKFSCLCVPLIIDLWRSGLTVGGNGESDAG